MDGDGDLLSCKMFRVRKIICMYGVIIVPLAIQKPQSSYLELLAVKTPYMQLKSRIKIFMV